MTIVTYLQNKRYRSRILNHWATIPSLVPLSGTGKKKEGGSKGGTDCIGGYKGVQAVRPEVVAGGGLPVHPLGLFMDKDYCRLF